MDRPRHPDKDIEAALQYAQSHGWTVVKVTGSGHAWGRLLCPANNSHCRNGIYCQQSIWSTPRNATNHARTLRKIVDKCEYAGDDNA